MLENAVAAHAAVFVEACDDGDVASKTVVAECFYGDSGVRAFKSGNVDGKGISVGICGRRALNFVEGWKMAAMASLRVRSAPSAMGFSVLMLTMARIVPARIVMPVNDRSMFLSDDFML